MTLLQEVVKLQPGSDELQVIRNNSLGGDLHAIKVFVFYSAYRKIKADPEIPDREKLKTLKKLIDANIKIRVTNG